MTNDFNHISVLLRESIGSLHIKNQGRYIDATLGAGGHTELICKSGGIVLGIDADPAMLEIARKRLEIACPGNFKLALGNFRDIAKIAEENEFKQVDGVIFDLGISNIHLEGNRGFSFRDENTELDMRLNPEFQQIKASDLINNLREDQLTTLFEDIADRNVIRRLVKEIIKYRETKKIDKVGDLLTIINHLPRNNFKIHPATKIFMALRMAVNSELETLREGLTNALSVLGSGGRIAVISFHSLEDKIVKNIFESWERQNLGIEETKKPIIPTEEELANNRKARSAKLRVWKKY